MFESKASRINFHGPLSSEHKCFTHVIFRALSNNKKSIIQINVNFDKCVGFNDIDCAID